MTVTQSVSAYWGDYVPPSRPSPMNPPPAPLPPQPPTPSTEPPVIK